MAISKINNTQNYRIMSNSELSRKYFAYNTAMAILTAAGIMAAVATCSNKNNNITDTRTEVISYNGCRTPQDKIIRDVEFSLGRKNPFSVSLIKDKNTQEDFIKLTAQIDNGERYTIAKIKENLGIEKNIIGKYNNPLEVAKRRNWNNDNATIDIGKSIKIPLKELGKVDNHNSDGIYYLKNDIRDFYNLDFLLFDKNKMNFENFIEKSLGNDKNSLKANLIGKDGKFFVRIERTTDNNKNINMYSMTYIKTQLGIQDFVIAHNNKINSINNNEWTNDALLLPHKYIDIPIDALGQTKDSAKNETLKRIVFSINN